VALPYLIDAAEEEDVAELLELERRCASHPWTERHFRGAIDPAARTQTLVARAPGPKGTRVIVGFCAVRRVVDEVHVENLAVRPSERRRGLARRLLRFVLERAVREGARAALLEVRESNAAARALYEREGFHVAGRREAYYNAPVEAAILLARVL
jgi:ribosomal-protein-alanine acetyltransferase